PSACTSTRPATRSASSWPTAEAGAPGFSAPEAPRSLDGAGRTAVVAGDRLLGRRHRRTRATAVRDAEDLGGPQAAVVPAAHADADRRVARVEDVVAVASGPHPADVNLGRVGLPHRDVLAGAEERRMGAELGGGVLVLAGDHGLRPAACQF